jgi:hypothetical protein
MELVVLNIGYDLGILSPEVFSMMVIMALLTTFMTGPALDLIERLFKEKRDIIQDKISQGKFKIILSFGNPEMGRSLLRLANILIKKQKENTSVTALHLCPNSVLHNYNIDEYENENFAPIIQESELLKQEFTSLFKATDDIENDITEITNKGDYDLLLIGIGQSIFEGSLLGKILGYTTRIINPDRLIQKVAGKEKMLVNSPFDTRTQNILLGSKVSVGIFVDKNMGKFHRVFVPFLSEKDRFLMEYIQRLINNSGTQVTITDTAEIIKTHNEIKEAISAIEHVTPNNITLSRTKEIDEKFIIPFQLMLVTTDGWKKLVDSRQSWIKQTPSILILQA